MQLNWIDWVILAIVGYYIIEGWETGIVFLLSNLISFLASLWLAVKYHTPVGNFLGDKFGLPPLWTSVLGYVLVALGAEAVLSQLFQIGARRLPKKLFTSQVSHWLGAAVSAVNSLVITSFILLLILALPLRGNIKRDIKDSSIGSKLVVLTEKYGGSVKSSLDQATQQAIRFLTVKPQSKERVALDVTPKTVDLRPDSGAENQLVDLVNKEREEAGVDRLRVDESMVVTSRGHSKDMFERKYFAHYDPQGHDAAWRMQKAGVDFQIVGENLAYAPDVSTAHSGLMDSEGHRKNILDPQFHRIGIGVIDGGVYGKMFTQLFAD